MIVRPTTRDVLRWTERIQEIRDTFGIDQVRAPNPLPEVIDGPPWPGVVRSPNLEPDK